MDITALGKTSVTAAKPVMAEYSHHASNPEFPAVTVVYALLHT
jgi:hypothetical protein